ncbi:alpha/beta fold hydrolase [Streptomyces sp. NPDC096319]|uniref:alpha/beta hydrolase n=1 Tax=Streptomyces sp. NPDC096319 TaxID=3366084 RepID=UPI0038022B37
MLRTTARRRALVLALALLGGTSLAACTGAPGQDAGRRAPAAADPAARADLRGFYGQKLAWRPCGDVQCASLTVPMDYSRPGDGRTFVLPVAKAATAVPGKRLGSLVLNPGGPGEPGAKLVEDGVADELGPGVRERFDVVSFDPRGVGGSEPALTCRAGDDSAVPDAAPPYPRTGAEREAALVAARAQAAACRKASGPLLPHVGTVDAARDLDVLRAALGERALTYVGWSYGTSLGTSYAEQFPRRVRAMVLDGAVDPSLDWRQRVLGQSTGFRDAVEEYADSCADVVGDGCPGASPGEIRALIDRLVERTRREPLPVDGSEEGLDAAGLVEALSLSMYTPEAQWEGLSGALRAADAGDGTRLAALAAGEEESPDDTGTDADQQAPEADSEQGTTGAGADADSEQETTGPDSDSDYEQEAIGSDSEQEATGSDSDQEATGSDSDQKSPGADPDASAAPASGVPEDNSEAAMIAVNCLDVPHPRDARAYWDALAPAHRAAGLYGTSGVTAELVCEDWPAGAQRPHRVAAAGVPPVLVVGTTGDPATPYAEAVSLARQFPGGMLLTFDAPGHTGYGRDACVDRTVEAYLVSLAKVRPGTRACLSDQAGSGSGAWCVRSQGGGERQRGGGTSQR